MEAQWGAVNNLTKERGEEGEKPAGVAGIPADQGAGGIGEEPAGVAGSPAVNRAWTETQELQGRAAGELDIRILTAG